MQGPHGTSQEATRVVKSAMSGLPRRERIYGWIERARAHGISVPLDEYNARIHEMTRSRPWPEVYQLWQDGFLRLLALAESIPAADVTDRTRFPWLNGYALVDVLAGSADHHREHLEGVV